MAEVIDFEDFRPVLDEVFEGIKRSCGEHGDWSAYTDAEAQEAVLGEMKEFLDALEAGDVYGRHGQVREGLDVMIVMAKFLRRVLCQPVSAN